ncbi:hypothetical protein RA086_09945 [Lactiplantibacillus sp. WILCCON 0030]|uniref:PIN domain-containing protein n=1 Tax=Lactiplantibacillus brownii TaxID=3069269 RepID=A0ABU1AAF5_9LACO|nr:hypothetical protein [Lactiplantibacillus brownii]MDQ7937929.1 hypothetical protein [Lactiplantibacillus brownii]
MMINSEKAVFIDTNVLFYASNFKKYDILNWLNSVYPQIIVHEDVWKEVRTQHNQKLIQPFLTDGTWRLFETAEFSSISLEVYNTRKEAITTAFLKMNRYRRQQGLRVKNTADLGEIAILATCLMLNTGLICSNDFDIRTVIEQEHYSIFDESLAQEKLIQQDSVADFCVKAYQNQVANRKAVRTFYKAVVGTSDYAQQQLDYFDQRLLKSK